MERLRICSFMQGSAQSAHLVILQGVNGTRFESLVLAAFGWGQSGAAHGRTADTDPLDDKHQLIAAPVLITKCASATVNDKRIRTARALSATCRWSTHLRDLEVLQKH